MFGTTVLRTSFRALRTRSPAIALCNSRLTPIHTRTFSYTPIALSKSNTPQDHDAATTAAEPGESGDHEGQYARTDDSVRVEYPEESELDSTKPVQGRGGFHFKRTLATFSLEGKVGVVTGGARGLGLVMAQALVSSGADVALVDMNAEEAKRSAEELIETFKNENAGSER